MSTSSPSLAPQPRIEVARTRPPVDGARVGQRERGEDRRFRQPAADGPDVDADLANTLLDPLSGMPPFGPGFPPPPLERPVFAATAPRCPLIIKVGQGLEHTIPTQVIYGRPGCR